MSERLTANDKEESRREPVEDSAPVRVSTRDAPDSDVSMPAGAEPPSNSHASVVRMMLIPRTDWRRNLALVIAAAIGVFFLWEVQSILLPFVISLFLAGLLDPTVRYLQAHGRSRIWAICTLYICFLSFVALVVVVVIPQMETQIEDLSLNFSGYYTNIQKTIDNRLHDNEKLLTMLGMKHRLQDILNQKSGPVQHSMNAVIGGLTGFLQDMASKILWLVIIPVSTFFLMRDYPLLRARFIALFPDPYHDNVDRMTREIVDVFGAYIRGLAKICFLYAIWASLLFYLLGLKYWLFLGLMAGTFYAVPYVGQLFTAVISSAIAYSMTAHMAVFFIPIPGASVGFSMFVVVACVVSQVVFDQIVFPRVVGESVGLHPVVSIFALMSGATLFGVWGMLLAVPIAASIQIVLTFFFPRLTQPLPPKLLERAFTRG